MLSVWLCLLTLIHLFEFGDTIVRCDQKNVTVNLFQSSILPQTTTESISTWLCWKQDIRLQANTIVHLTIHGFTYDHNYWSFPYQSPNYSYVDYVIENSNGIIAVLNIDRLGVGFSSKPNASYVTLDSHAYVIYQLTNQLRNGFFRDIYFKRIILVGHSLGTIIALATASNTNYNQHISGLIATGALHLSNSDGVAVFAASFYSVQLDPKFSNQSLPTGYITINLFNNTRQIIFYNVDDADRNVITLDEQLRQTGTVGELPAFEALQSNITALIPSIIPVLVVVGQNDIIFCHTTTQSLSCNNSLVVQQREQSSYSTSIETYVLPKAGHGINLHLNSKDWYQQALIWTEKFFEKNTGVPRPGGGYMQWNTSLILKSFLTFIVLAYGENISNG